MLLALISKTYSVSLNLLNLKREYSLEDHSRRNNLRFDGFKEETNERWEESENIVTDFVKKKLDIEEDILIKRAHRTGKIKRNME